MSHPVWGAWIEISHRWRSRSCQAAGRTPYGVRGLKFQLIVHNGAAHESHPVWGAWIEIASACSVVSALSGRTPYGVRGLKFQRLCRERLLLRSHPVWGAWIEIMRWIAHTQSVTSRTPYGVRGLKFRRNKGGDACASRTPYGVRGLKLRTATMSIRRNYLSHPVWGAWIEIGNRRDSELGCCVAPRTGCVD